MRNPLVARLLLVVSAVWAAPQAGSGRPETPLSTMPDPDPDPDPLSLELLTLPLLRSMVQSLSPPDWDAEAMTREQALLYLFVLHDHDRSGHLDGLELLQLLGMLLAQRDGTQPGPEAVVELVDRALERQDLSRDGLLDPSELFLVPGRDPELPRQPLLQPPGQPWAGAVPGRDTEGPGEDQEVRGPGDGPMEGQAAPQAETSQAGAVEVEEAPEAEAPSAETVEAEEALEAGGPETEALSDGAPEAGIPQEEATPVWKDPGEG
ncbi:cell growth regulator with EF hand domain protein 1 [Apus apus]|uniref:cell growth regulator with EF hand domain protein 1 n=1 Tax=Apus apus TaxID=8895 RepID=UPI0021F83BAA|nr:cell growth regulator with EF hand domain protein 1 [Apus apus]XP_051471484.1 cell growth regulator with EF hand domain protein 1 [Apus apus]XP_051471485.1 cell growth regulator with EF hand domain protein 1 [Apus apus]